jgi:UDP-3-O-[3-hydroxymyristoyl] N-acetylglucosamine deacetylase/3-hydroxyacyl-[acyl-carrier-protein] dehydratase
MRPSHAANCEFARLIQAQIRKPAVAVQSFTPPPLASETGAKVLAEEDGCVMNVEQIMKALPHRYPFIMLDRIAKIDGNRIVGVKCVTMNEPFFQGHFPGHPIMPGVLQLEAIAQVAGILLMRKAQAAGQIAYFMSAENVKWRKPVVPGDTLVIEIELTKTRGKIGKAKGICKVRGDVVSEADVTFMLLDAEPA